MKKTLIAVGAGLSVPVVFGGALMVWAATANAAKPGTEPAPEPELSWPVKLYCEQPDSYSSESFTIEIPQDAAKGAGGACHWCPSLHSNKDLDKAVV